MRYTSTRVVTGNIANFCAFAADIKNPAQLRRMTVVDFFLAHVFEVVVVCDIARL